MTRQNNDSTIKVMAGGKVSGDGGEGTANGEVDGDSHPEGACMVFDSVFFGIVDSEKECYR